MCARNVKEFTDMTPFLLENLTVNFVGVVNQSAVNENYVVNWWKYFRKC